jgi:hypothetical protein
MIGSSSEFMVRQAIASVVVTVLGADNKSRDGTGACMCVRIHVCPYILFTLSCAYVCMCV